MQSCLLRFLSDEVLPEGAGHDLAHISETLLDFDVLRSSLSQIGLCTATTDNDTLFTLYMNGPPEARAVSPCRLFSESWYRERYPDIAVAIARGLCKSGFVHYIKVGFREGRWPSLAMQRLARTTPPDAPIDDPRLHTIRLDAHAYMFLAVFSWISPVEYYNLYGRHMGCSAETIALPRDSYAELRRMQLAEFDAPFYRARYLNDVTDIDAFDHYCTIGIKQRFSPNAWFQEDWYRAFYWDVHEAIERGALSSGFCHYLLSGRAEGRLPAFELSKALEQKMPGVTDPVLLKRTEFLRDRVHRVRDIHPPSVADRDTATVWFVLPVLNADISFGGYQACYALMTAIWAQQFHVGIICMEEQRPNREYFIWRTHDPTLREILQTCEVVGRDHLPRMEIGARDFFVSYSVWDLAVAAAFAQRTQHKLPFLLMQEYEPIFYDSSAMRAICAAQYDIDHIPIINSQFLCAYARANQIGAFDSKSHRNHSHFCFEHKINALPAQSAQAMSTRRRRVLAAYARPEAHASRNLFEMVVISLQRLCAAGTFGPEWSFIGLGALSDLPDIYLGNGHSLKLMQKMDEQTYVEFMQTLDIGISMMDAPHPSVIPFEFATTGALVITNTYENRSAADLTAMSTNFIPCAPSLEGMESALAEALARVTDFEDRADNVYAPATASWSKVFSPSVIRTIFGRATRPLSVVTAAPATPPPRRVARKPQGRVIQINAS